jgi:hypothetical protein
MSSSIAFKNSQHTYDFSKAMSAASSAVIDGASSPSFSSLESVFLLPFEAMARDREMKLRSRTRSLMKSLRKIVASSTVSSQKLLS